MNVPEYNQQIRTDRTAQGYSQVNIPQQAFVKTGELNRAVAYASRAFSGLIEQQIAEKDKNDKTRMIDLGNQLDKELTDISYNPDNGYYTTLGKNAVDNYDSYMNNLEELKQKYIDMGKDYGLSDDNAAILEQHLNGKLINYQKGAYGHLTKQRTTYELSVYNENVDNNTLLAVHNRNIPDATEQNIINIKSGAKYLGQTLGYDEKATEAIMKEKVSIARSNVAEALLADDTEESIKKASEYIEEHKDELAPEKYIELTKKIKHMNIKYEARKIADKILTSSNSEYEALNKARQIENLELSEKVYSIVKQKTTDELRTKSRETADNILALGLSEEESIKKAETISDVNLSDATVSRIKQNFSDKRRIENQYQSDLMNDFYNTAVQKLKNGETITIDDLPQGLNGKNYLLAKNAVDSFNKSGDVKTDGETLTYLQHTAAYDAQRFKSLDLSMYRLSLSDADFKTLQKRQENIKKGDYYTVLKDNKATIDYIEQVTGIKNADKKLFEQYQQMIRNHEERTGEKATDIEKEQFLKYLGADKNNYKTIEKRVKDNAEFYADIANKVSYYQSKHNGDMPDTETFNKWLKDETVQYANKKYTQYLNYAKTNVTAKPHEQKMLTFFADDYVPSLSKSIGVNLKVSSRYRPANGKYKSKHSEGRALDISYLTKEGKSLTVNQKFNLIENVLQRPEVQAIAISSADKDGKAVLEKLMKKYGRKYGSKIQDMNRPDANGKTRDQNLGTNHTHHVHITLYSDKTFGGTDPVTVKNQLKQRGFTDEQIADYIKARGLS